ncbi:MAG: Gfo/Idh/MocA family oxidoreductase [Planctomycetes bacterium]|nr:Gfo/Idh/MocA family oxidoreductase [Planctomycetota bacterium]
MTDTVRIAVLGLVHDHIWGAMPHFAEVEGVELVGAADPNQPLLEKFQAQSGCDKVYRDYEELLDREQLDAVLAYGTNRSTAELVEMAAERGLHVMTEKPMASSLEVADRMLVAARKAGVILMVNWPIAWSPSIQHAYRLVREGRIGRPWQLKWRGGHGGPRELGCSKYFCDWLFDPQENGAGALFDYLGYGASLARLFIGLPNRVTAIAGRLVKDYIPVDDNAIVALEYAHANAVIECTWTEAVPDHPPHDLIVYGTEGVLVAGGDNVITRRKGDDDDQVHQPPALEAPRRNSLQYFVHCIRAGEPVEGVCSPENSLDAQQVMDAARLSVLTGSHISLPLVDHLYPM